MVRMYFKRWIYIYFRRKEIGNIPIEGNKGVTDDVFLLQYMMKLLSQLKTQLTL